MVTLLLGTQAVVLDRAGRAVAADEHHVRRTGPF
jgi:hypothetical protein